MTLSVTVCQTQNHTDIGTAGLARDVRSDLSQHKVTMAKEANDNYPTLNPTYRPLLQANTKPYSVRRL